MLQNIKKKRRIKNKIKNREEASCNEKRQSTRVCHIREIREIALNTEHSDEKK